MKYALSDGASLGKVLTPPYITSMMAKLLDANRNSHVMDIATGSAAFLVAAMGQMISDANRALGKNTKAAQDAIALIKETQLLGIEIDAKMYTLAASNMILRGDGSTQIKKADTFTTPEAIFTDFGADVLLLNPPFSYTGNGLPFFEFGLDHMKKDGYGAVIIQDSVGAGKAVDITKSILQKHTLMQVLKCQLICLNQMQRYKPVYTFSKQVHHIILIMILLNLLISEMMDIKGQKDVLKKLTIRWRDIMIFI